MPTRLSDKEIITNVLQGNQQDFAYLVERHQNYVFSLVLRFIKNHQEAEEVAQDVFVKAYRYLADFRGDSKFSTWLYTIVNTTCITFLRKKKLDIRSLDDDKTFETADNIHSDFQANQVEQKSKLNMVNKAISLLKPEDAQVVTLFYKGEQTLEEIGKIMGIEPNNVKVKLYRARQKLKEKMERNFAAEINDL